MAIIKNVSDLRVYQTSLKLLEKIYDLAYKVPHLRLRTQIIGSSEAVSPLITEGFARKQNPKEATRFYTMAMAESDETISHLEKMIILSKRFSRIPAEHCETLIEEYKSLSKQLNRLVQTWRNFS